MEVETVARFTGLSVKKYKMDKITEENMNKEKAALIEYLEKYIQAHIKNIRIINEIEKKYEVRKDDKIVVDIKYINYHGKFMGNNITILEQVTIDVAEIKAKVFNGKGDYEKASFHFETKALKIQKKNNNFEIIDFSDEKLHFRKL